MLRAVAILLGLARMASATLLADSMSVSGDSISRGFDANTSSCNYTAVLDPPTAMSGQCAQALLPCTFSGTGASRRCR